MRLARGTLVCLCLMLVAGTVIGLTLSRSRPDAQGPVPSDAARRPALPLQVRQPAMPAPSPPIRVNLTSTPVRSLRLAVDGAWRVQPEAGGAPVRGERLPETEVTLTATGFRIGGQEYRGSRLEIVAERPPAIWIGDHQYRGLVRLERRDGGTFIAVNELPLEEYLASVIDGEMPAAFPDAARQAQAVVARTYALYQMHKQPRHPSFDVYASTQSQRYLGHQYRDAGGRRLAGESEASRRIARSTAGLVCTWQGRLFCTYYSAVCGGRTTPGNLVFRDAAPPLRSVDCRWCEEARLYRWTAEIPKQAVQSALAHHFASTGRAFGPLASIAASGRPDAPPTVRVSDGRRQHEIAGADLRRLLAPGTLHSANFTIRTEGDKLVFQGRGHGHGVGFCQWGARGQALAGRHWREIVQHYYPGARIAIQGRGLP